MKRIIGSHLCTAVGSQQFRKESRKRQTKIIFEQYYSFFNYCLLSYRYVMFQKSIPSRPKWGALSQLQLLHHSVAWKFFKMLIGASHVNLTHLLYVKQNVIVFWHFLRLISKLFHFWIERYLYYFSHHLLHFFHFKNNFWSTDPWLLLLLWFNR